MKSGNQVYPKTGTPCARSPRIAATEAFRGYQEQVRANADALGDEAGAALRELLELAGVEVVDLGLAGRTPEKIRVRADGRSLLRLDRLAIHGGEAAYAAIRQCPKPTVAMIFGMIPLAAENFFHHLPKLDGSRRAR